MERDNVAVSDTFKFTHASDPGGTPKASHRGRIGKTAELCGAHGVVHASQFRFRDRRVPVAILEQFRRRQLA